MARGASPVLAATLLALAAACWVSAAFVPAAGSAAKVAQPPAGAAIVAGAAAPLLASQPAFAADSPPGWPYALVFSVVFVGIFVIPNTIWKGK